jgi:hypothetical protein
MTPCSTSTPNDIRLIHQAFRMSRVLFTHGHGATIIIVARRKIRHSGGSRGWFCMLGVVNWGMEGEPVRATRKGWRGSGLGLASVS